MDTGMSKRRDLPLCIKSPGFSLLPRSSLAWQSFHIAKAVEKPKSFRGHL